MPLSGLTTGNASQNPGNRRTAHRRLLALAALALVAIVLPACQAPYNTGDAVKSINEAFNYGLADHLESLDIDPEEARKSGVKLACPDLAYEGKAISCTLTGRYIEKTQLKMQVDDKGDLDFAGNADLKTAVVGALNEKIIAGMPPLLEMTDAGPAVADRAGISIECPGRITAPTPACIISGRLSGRSAPVKVRLRGITLDFANNQASKAAEKMLMAEATAAQRIAEQAQ